VEDLLQCLVVEEGLHQPLRILRDLHSPHLLPVEEREKPVFNPKDGGKGGNPSQREHLRILWRPALQNYPMAHILKLAGGSCKIDVLSTPCHKQVSLRSQVRAAQSRRH
jgi:hypothetical protein